MKKLLVVAQVIGYSALGLLALYLVLSDIGGGGLARAAQRLAPASAPLAATSGTIPQTMNYQGYLRNPDGSLMTGTHDITAKIYDAASAGSALYATTIQDVALRDGLFEIVLGDQDLLPTNAFASAPRFIGIALDGGAEFIPRQRVHAVPWSMMATTAMTATFAQEAQTATTLAPNAILPGPVSIGTGQGDLIPELVVGPPSGGRHFVVNDIDCARWGLSTGYFDLSFQNDRPAYINDPQPGCAPLPPDQWRTIMKLEDNGDVNIGEPGVVTGTLRVNGDITWSGALGNLSMQPGLDNVQGFALYTQQGPKQMDLISSVNSICFLTSVQFKSVYERRCSVENDTGREMWIMIADQGTTSNQDYFASCRARCLKWGP